MKIINEDLVQLDNLTERDIEELGEMVCVIAIFENDRAYVPKSQWELIDPAMRGMFE